MSEWGAYVSSELRKLSELELFFSKLLSPISIYLWIKGIRQLKERRNLEVSRMEVLAKERTITIRLNVKLKENNLYYL